MAFARTIVADQKGETSKLHIMTDVEGGIEYIETEEIDILWMTVDNSANGAASYVKLFNTVAATLGATAPDAVFMIPASVTRTIMWTSRLANIFTATLGIACVTTAIVSGTTSPTSAVNINLAVREPEE